MLFSGRGYLNHLKGACLNKMLFSPCSSWSVVVSPCTFLPWNIYSVTSICSKERMDFFCFNCKIALLTKLHSRRKWFALAVTSHSSHTPQIGRKYEQERMGNPFTSCKKWSYFLKKQHFLCCTDAPGQWSESKLLSGSEFWLFRFRTAGQCGWMGIMTQNVSRLLESHLQQFT